MNTYNIRKKISHFTLNIIVWILVLIVNFPLIWMVLSSIKQPEEVYNYPPTFISRNPTLSHYIQLFQTTNFSRYFLNSVIVTFFTVIITIIIATLTAYAMTRFKLKGTNLLSKIYIFIYFIPGIVMLIPTFLIMKTLGILDTPLSLILGNLIFTFPYCYLMLRSYFGSISQSMEEAAMVDGASRMGAFVRIVLPVAIPGIISASIFAAILSWNEYLYALTLISTDSKRTLTVGVSLLTEQLAIPSWGMLMAASVVITLPMLIFFLFMQRGFVVGLTAGALKE